MTDEVWKKVTAASARAIVDEGELESDSAQLLKESMRPEAFINALIEADRLPDAIKVMARALPVREAVWWACVCTRQMAGLDGDKAQSDGVAAAEAWVYDPSDANREKAFEVVKTHDSTGGGTLCAMAAAYSAGNVPLGEGQSVDLDTSILPQLLTGAVMTAAAEQQGEAIKARLRLFLSSGEDIARGGNGRITAAEGDA